MISPRWRPSSQNKIGLGRRLLRKRGTVKVLDMNAKRDRKRVSVGVLDGREGSLSVESTRLRIIALDFSADSSFSNRREVYPKSTAVINFNPQEAVITTHGTRIIKGKIP